jgi:hypothetical protein
MGISGDDAACPVRNYIEGDNRRLNLSGGEAFGLAERISRYQSQHRFISRKEVDMTTQYHQVMTKILIVVAVALGSSAAGAAPVGADPNPIGSAPNSFGGLSCSCRETAPPGSPVLREEIEQGIRDGRTAWLPGLSPSTQPRQSP